MPELPEVEAARRALEAHCVGRRITRCAVADDTKVVVSAAGRVAFERAMVGRTIVAARRRGKNLWLRLAAPPFPSFQFGQYPPLAPHDSFPDLPCLCLLCQLQSCSAVTRWRCISLIGNDLCSIPIEIPCSVNMNSLNCSLMISQ